MSRVPIFALAALIVGASACSSPKSVKSKTEPLEGFDVALDVRTSNYASGEIAFDALAKNSADHALIGLTISVSVERADGTELQRIDVVPIGTRAEVSVLEPGFSVPVIVRQKVLEQPALIVARITKAELFSQPADSPQVLQPTSNADALGLEVVSFGHFRIDSVGDPGPAPFRATLGICNMGSATISRLDYGIVFRDDQGRDVDRIPLVHVFEPPLKPGDAVLEQVNGSARSFDKLLVDVRSATKAD
jgi:hypothetical protein